MKYRAMLLRGIIKLLYHNCKIEMSQMLKWSVLYCFLFAGLSDTAVMFLNISCKRFINPKLYAERIYCFFKLLELGVGHWL